MIVTSSWLCQQVVAQSFPPPLSNHLRLSAGLETRNEDFRWSIAGNSAGTNPNILSEIIFNPVRAVGFGLDASYDVGRRFRLDLEYSQLYTYSGSATDFDYEGDNRTLPSVELYLNSNKGKMRNSSARFLYRLTPGESFVVQAGLGYSAAKELFYLLNENDPELQTTYLAKWNGPAIALHANWISPWRFQLGAAADYHLFQYQAEANWNTIENFQHPVSFLQTAGGTGWNYQANAGYRFNRHLETRINWKYSNWQTRKGIDRLFLTNGDKPETQMNGAFKKASGWSLSATYHF